jgi:hypothetical protein
MQICYIQFRVNLDTFEYEFVSKIKIVVYQFVHKMTAKRKIISLKKIGPHWSPGMQEYVISVLRSTEDMQNTWKKYTIGID